MSYKHTKLTRANTPTATYGLYSLYKISIQEDEIPILTPTSVEYFVIDGNAIVGFKGGVTDIVIPSSYSLGEPTVTQSDGILINYDYLFHFGMRLGSMYSSATFKDPITEYSRTFYGEDLSMHLEEMFRDGAYLESITFYSPEEASYNLPQILEEINAYPITINGVTYNDVYEFENAIFENMLTDFSFSGEQTIYPIIDGDDYPINTIAYRAFEGCSELKSVVIPDGITNIESYAFYYCSNLSNVNIPNGVTTIMPYTFQFCPKLTNIIIPNSVTEIWNGAFSNSGLYSITIPSSVTSIAEQSFYRCDSLTHITVEPSNSIYDSRNNCNCVITTSTNTLLVGSNSSIIPNDVTIIGDSSFTGRSTLVEIIIPDGVTIIDDQAFASCQNLTSVTIPDSVTSIGYYVFNGCRSLTNITLPSGLTSIGTTTFKGCISLTNIAIPSSVTSIGSMMFYQCTNLVYVNIYTVSVTTKVSSSSSGWFNGCSSTLILHIPASVTSPTTAYGQYWNYYSSSGTLTYYADL